MGKRNVQFFVTGFGKFQGVEHNPTTVLIQKLKEKNRSDVKHAEVLDVSAVDTLAALVQLQNICKKHTVIILYSIRKWESCQIVDRNNWIEQQDDLAVFLHFGVYSGSNCIYLEKYGYNEADFRISDERGWAPEGQSISKYHEKILQTKLDLDKILTSISAEKMDKYPIAISDNPGRFVCNFIYFNSLAMTQESPNQYSLFVHVPNFTEISIDKQFDFVESILDQISTSLI